MKFDLLRLFLVLEVDEESAMSFMYRKREKGSDNNSFIFMASFCICTFKC